ncbi:hypothetical protein B0A49_06091 [Cryomyces minteri]|uniref:TUG ubiquitin-like domain-containing protein n=1 Tax=Cryomyces minteri TaxID=331657 RepID=A0A4U0XLU9_9PEZI|nr:hypothetical protein B0A49_06091 [Cryomyces minteri]
MASHVFVMNSSAHRTQIKTTPRKTLREVLEEACTKLKLNPDDWTLKHNNRALDLSLPIQHARLSSGAKLELVRSSRSPSVISVALQLPSSENNVRLTNKFASTTTLWQILRQFESGAVGNDSTPAPANLNITLRGTPQTSNGTSAGAGRLYYEQPCLRVGQKEVSTFEELQKSLGQIGLSGGNVLLRLSYKDSGKPLDEALTEITQYFKAIGDDGAVEISGSAHGAHAQGSSEHHSAFAAEDVEMTDTTSGSDTPRESVSTHPEDTTPTATSAAASSEPTDARPTNFTAHPAPQPDQEAKPSPPSSASDSTNRPVSVFARPSSSTPLAASQPYNEADYVPSIEHAKAHQKHLNTRSQNQRLPSDAELAARAQELDDRTTAVDTLHVRVRLPDEMAVGVAMQRDDTAAILYAVVRAMLVHAGHPFVLRYMGSTGRMATLAEDGKKLLGRELKFSPRGEVVHLVWDAESANSEARKGPTLLEEYRRRAKALKIETPRAEEPEEQEVLKGPGKGEERSKGGASLSKEDRMKKFLGKKK